MMTTPKPAIAERITNATLAAGRVVDAVVEGEPVRVTPEEREARIETCHRCPAYESPLGECGLCGCYVALKAWLRTENCPARKWAGDTDRA